MPVGRCVNQYRGGIIGGVMMGEQRALMRQYLAEALYALVCVPNCGNDVRACKRLIAL
jgi:hypothetical protein